MDVSLMRIALKRSLKKEQSKCSSLSPGGPANPLRLSSGDDIDMCACAGAADVTPTCAKK